MEYCQVNHISSYWPSYFFQLQMVEGNCQWAYLGGHQGWGLKWQDLTVMYIIWHSSSVSWSACLAIAIFDMVDVDQLSKYWQIKDRWLGSGVTECSLLVTTQSEMKDILTETDSANSLTKLCSSWATPVIKANIGKIRMLVCHCFAMYYLLTVLAANHNPTYC